MDPFYFITKNILKTVMCKTCSQAGNEQAPFHNTESPTCHYDATKKDTKYQMWIFWIAIEMDYKFLQNDPEIGMKMVFAYVSMSDMM